MPAGIQAAVYQRPWVCSARGEAGFATGAGFFTTGFLTESTLWWAPFVMAVFLSWAKGDGN
jgi:hypothetical protein